MNSLLLLACQNEAPASGMPPAPIPVVVAPPPAPDTVRPDSLPLPSAGQKPIQPPATDVKADAEVQPDKSMPPSGVPDRTPPAPGSKPTTPAQNGFAEVTTLDRTIRLDIRYATTDNFTKSKIYDCPRCLLRPEAAAAIVKAHKTLQKKGFGLKMFDCYRPRPYQQRLWDKVPDPNYVTPPTKGSMHSRGAAVDLTIVDAQGRELNMGTAYDFFGVAAHTDHTNLPAKVLTNRRLLRETLEAVGFKGIRTEWWHFSYQGKSYPLSDYVWPCND